MLEALEFLSRPKKWVNFVVQQSFFLLVFWRVELRRRILVKLRSSLLLLGAGLIIRLIGIRLELWLDGMSLDHRKYIHCKVKVIDSGVDLLGSDNDYT